MEANRIIARALSIIDQMDQTDSKWNQDHPFQHKDRVPLLILSHPGFGKTSTVRKWCDYMDYNLVSLIPSQNAADDILGINCMVDNKMVRLTPSWFNHMMDLINSNNKRTVLFIDEISTCDSYIQGPLLNLIFNRSLGEAYLPENVMVVAAGNYAEDLHNAFQMSEPLVNRFMLLNLYTSDYNIAEQIQGQFHSVTSKDDIKAYLGLEDETPAWDVQKLKDWITTSREVTYAKIARYQTHPDFGIRGCTTPRSLDFSLRFAEMYFTKYADTYWTRIIGDTLGSSDKRDNKPLRTVFESQIAAFKVSSTVITGNDTFLSICKDIEDSAKTTGTPDAKQVEKLKRFVEQQKSLELTYEETLEMVSLKKKYSASAPLLKEILILIQQKLAG